MKCKRKIMVGIAFVAVVLCILFQSNTFGRKKSELIIEEVDLKNNCIYATAKNQLYDSGILVLTILPKSFSHTPNLACPNLCVFVQSNQILQVPAATLSLCCLRNTMPS